jgi:phosphatidylglycerophosphatase A
MIPSLRRPSVLLATWFGAGLLPRAPGTWGSLAALPCAWLIDATAGRLALAVATAAVFALGCWAAQRYIEMSGVKDPGQVVIDEVAGQWLVLLAAPRGLLYYAAGFLLFRLLDITKPWPASWADRDVPGGFGVMLDDILAAAYGFVGLYLFVAWRGPS